MPMDPQGMDPRGIDLQELDSRPFALLLCGTDESGEDDWVAFGGVARCKENGLFLERGRGQSDFEIRPEWYDRIRSIDGEVKEILNGADYVLSLSVGNLEDDPNGTYLPTGLKWPQSGDPVSPRSAD